jgi:uncharacterized protein (TIGR02145 family)
MISFKNVLKISGVILIILSIFLTNSCKNDKASFPTLTTTDISVITQTTATSGGSITNDGGAIILSSGVCWSTSVEPTIVSNKTVDAAVSGSFKSNITGLEAGTIYYVSAYATNRAGTGYGDQKTFTTLRDLVFGSVTDLEGNIYKTIKIGNQVWLAENLKSTKYNDGIEIPLVTDNTSWSNLTTSGYCWYNNDASTYKNTYGALYNWYAVSTGKLCPTGWHVPSDAEWKTLEMFLGMIQEQADSMDLRGTTEGGKMKEAGTAHWNTPNTGATNESGFSGLPGGYRYGTFFSSVVWQYPFYSIEGIWWSSTEFFPTINWHPFWDRALGQDHAKIYRNASERSCGHSVRCLKDI